MRRFIPFILLLAVLIVVPFRGYAATSGSNAIGIRVFKNPEGLSASDWYRDQCKGVTKAFLKCGTLTPVVVDGYDGGREGNTVYVNVANLGGDQQLYTNIFVFSLSEGAGSAGEDIFQQLIANIRFNTNMSARSDRDALRRDTRRRAAVQSLRRALLTYHAREGHYPDLLSGTYIRGTSFSTWPSWQETLGVALGLTMPRDEGRPFFVTDPKNANIQRLQWENFVGCASPHDPKTCWDAIGATMHCPSEAYVFGYRMKADGGPPFLGTTYEYSGPGNWRDTTLADDILRSICTP